MSRKSRGRVVRYGSAPALQQPSISTGQTPLAARAAALYEQGRLNEAETLSSSILSFAPRDHQTLHTLAMIARRKGEHSRAADLLRQAIAVNSRIAYYHGNLGNTYLETHRFADAAASYRRALRLEPGSPLAHFGLGLALLAQNAFSDAAKELEAALRARPDHSDTHLNLGIALTELGRIDEAIAHCQRAVALSPRYAGGHLRLGIAVRAKPDLPAACAHLARAIELDPELADAHFQLGITLRLLKRPEEAVLALRRALTRRPDMIEALINLGEVLTELQQFDEAVRCYERALKLNSQSPALYRAIGQVLYGAGRFGEARDAYTRALELEPDNAQNYVEIGRTYQSEGRFAEAIACQEKAISIQPDNGEAHYNLAMMRHADDSEARLQRLKQVLALDSLETDKRVALNFTLAKTYDAAGDFDAAFGCYKAGNELRSAQHPYRAADYTAFIDRVIASFNKNALSEKEDFGSESDRPVFVFGIMRSGTTLVEQILASHPQVHGHGELEYLREIVRTLPDRLRSGEPYPECIASLDAKAARDLAEAHLARLRGDAGNATRSVDKMPHNFARLGLISLLFPRAKLIHCTRDPLDNCLSCYFQYNITARFAHDLTSLGQFYRDYERLMAHWRAILRNPILDVPYEALIAEPEAWARRLLDFIDLPWDERCLSFYETQRPVFTPSFWQVRQPIYTSSIGRWRHYAKHLDPLYKGLGIDRPVE